MKFNFSINKMKTLVLKYPFLKPFDKEINGQLLKDIEKEISKITKIVSQYKKDINNYDKDNDKLTLKKEIKEIITTCNLQKQILIEYLKHARKIYNFNNKKQLNVENQEKTKIDFPYNKEKILNDTLKVSELSNLYLYLLNTLEDFDSLKQIAIKLVTIYNNSKDELKEEMEILINTLKHKTILKRRELKKQNKKDLVNKLKTIYSIFNINYKEINFYDNRIDIIKYWLDNPNNYDKIKRLLELMPDVVDITINNKNIIFLILEYYFESIRTELKNQTSNYISKEYYEQIFNLFINNPNFKTEYESLIILQIEEFKESIKNYKKYPDIVKSISNLGKKEINLEEDIKEVDYSSFNYLYHRQMNLNETYLHDYTFAITSLDNPYINKCYSATINDKGRVVIKVHTIDISAYIKYDELDYYFKNKMFKDIEPIFPMDIITNYLSFEPFIKRPAITYEVELLNNGRIASFDIYKSIVTLDKIYSYNNFKLPNEETIYSYYTLLNDFDLEPKDFGKNLEKMYLSKVSRAVGTYFNKRNLPCIYRVQDKQDEETFVKDMSQLNSLMGKLNKKDAKIIYQIMCEDTNKAYYASKNIGHDSCKQSYFLDLFSPIDNYLTLILQKLIDDFYINEKEYKIDEWKNEIENIISLANKKRIEQRTKNKVKTN